MMRAVLLFVVLPAVMSRPDAASKHKTQREKIILKEQAARIGGTGEDLTCEEELVSEFLLKEKQNLINESRVTGALYPGQDNFLKKEHRELIRSSAAYDVIQKMPKGGNLHVHVAALTSIDWLVKNVTYRDSLYMCETKDGTLKFRFHESTPDGDDDCPHWQSVSDARAKANDITTFDQRIHNSLSLVSDDPETDYPNINAVWDKFEQFFSTSKGLERFEGVYEEFVCEGLKQFLQDGVQYVELRGSIPSLYRLDGTYLSDKEVLNRYRRVLQKFKADNPDFIGFKLIVTTYRQQSKEKMLAKVKEVMSLYQENPDLVVGFDMVGQEDPNNPLIAYLEELLYPSRQDPPVHLPYFFHAGETVWAGTQVDYNMVDALLLNTKRIGHAYALYKHPVLMKMVKKRNIPIEVNPISNQVLELVEDMRNHPAAALIADNYPITICSDDPATWESRPLTDDFYLTFMALTDREATLATLKQLARNSLDFSALDEDDKEKAFSSWEKCWNKFISKTLHDYNLRHTHC